MSEISELEPRKPALSGDGEQLEYRAVSMSAVAALLLSGVSLLAFFHPVLWLIPVATVVVASFALKVISNDETLIGRAAAAIGLLVALFVLAAAPAHHISRQQMLYATARQHVDQWIQLIREKKLEEAFELTQDYGDRRPQGASLKEIYDESTKAKMNSGDNRLDAMMSRMIVTPHGTLTNFFEQQPMSKIIELGDQAEVRFLGNVRLTRKVARRTDLVTQQFALVYEVDSQPVSRLFEVETERKFYEGLGQAHWRILNARIPERIER